MRKSVVRGVIAVIAVCALWLPAQMGASAAARPHLLKSAVPFAVRSGQAHVVGRLAPNRQLDLVVTLKIRSWSTLTRELKAITTPGSPQYGHYLSQTEANKLFNPTAAQQQQVTSWLASNGITVTHTYVNHLGVDAHGSVGAVERAFGISLDRFRTSGLGHVQHFYAPATAPRVPAALSSVINGVLGLSDTTHFVDYVVRRHGDSNLGGYYPSDYRAAYDVPSSETGAGQHIGITLFDDPPSDASLTTWATKVGLGASKAPTAASKRLVIHKVDGGVSDGDSGESAIDIENSYGLAPGAIIDYWEYDQNNNNVDTGFDALNLAGTTGPKSLGLSGLPIEHQISSSWGECEDSNDDSASLDPMFASNSTTGHDYLFASGDTGSYCPESATASKDDPYPQYPGDSPYVTGVGGTAFGKDGNNAPATLTSYPGEVSWYYAAKGNTDSDQCWSASVACPEGSSGGFATQYKRPWYQNGVPGMASLGACAETGTAHICRGFPDVAAAGDPNFAGAVICYSAGCEVDGGTSLASPIWAGMLADMNGYISSYTGGRTLGFVNPALYYLATYNHTRYVNGFHDIVCPDATTKADGGCANGKYSTGTGWDAVSGLGSPNVAKLQADLAYFAR